MSAQPANTHLVHLHERNWSLILLSETDIIEALYKKRLSRQDALLLILCVDANTPKEVTNIKQLGRQAGLTEIQKWNVSEILGRAKGLAIRLPRGWAITSNGRAHIQKLDILPKNTSPKTIHFASSLRHNAKSILSADTIVFMEEAIKCFEVGFYRSSVVLSWVGAISLLQDQIFKHHLAIFNIEAQKKDAKWKAAKTKDDLSRMKESEFLDIIGTPPISLIGKNVKEELKNNCLQLRNACGHPNSLKIGENRVAAHLEILIMNIFSKFS
jgi:hypothetical protein